MPKICQCRDSSRIQISWLMTLISLSPSLKILFSISWLISMLTIIKDWLLFGIMEIFIVRIKLRCFLWTSIQNYQEFLLMTMIRLTPWLLWRIFWISSSLFLMRSIFLEQQWYFSKGIWELYFLLGIFAMSMIWSRVLLFCFLLGSETFKKSGKLLSKCREFQSRWIRWYLTIHIVTRPSILGESPKLQKKWSKLLTIIDIKNSSI